MTNGKLDHLTGLEEILGFSFKDRSLLLDALRHSSYINENPGSQNDSNERLEFLGDSVLGLVVAEKLFESYPASDEGRLTQLRSALVRRETLAGIAREIKLGNYLSMGKGEEAGGGRDKNANLAGAFEALIAAIYLDRGLKTARSVILKLFGPEIHKQANQVAETDYKSKIQEIIQARWQQTPDYVLLEAAGPDHDKLFSVEVRAGNMVLGAGTGKSKKAAEMAAAKMALEKL
jgi:ribonuclease-3